MALTLLERLAAGAEAPVFVACGAGALDRIEALRRAPGVRLVETPRAAAILLVAGEVGEASRHALMALHDQMAPPRAALAWGARPPIPAYEIAAGADAAPSLRARWRELMRGEVAGAPDLLPDTPPNPWRGLGDRGHGGEGMMGGTPYGRPMAMPDADPRDGLTLDAYTARFGPFLPMWPPGLRMELTLQGDVIVAARLLQAPFAQPGTADTPAACAARLLRLLGLAALAARLARRDSGGVARAARRTGVLAAIPPGLGRLPDGHDTRQRLARWLTGAAALPDGGAPMPFPDLRGLEWHEAALVLNSVETARLRGAALAGADEVEAA